MSGKSNNVSNCCCKTSAWSQAATELKWIIFSWFRPKEPNYRFGKVPMTISFRGLSDLALSCQSVARLKLQQGHVKHTSLKHRSSSVRKAQCFHRVPLATSVPEAWQKVTWGNFSHFDCVYATAIQHCCHNCSLLHSPLSIINSCPIYYHLLDRKLLPKTVFIHATVPISIFFLLYSMISESMF